MFAYFLGRNLEAEFLGHMLSVCLIFLETAKLFCKDILQLTFSPPGQIMVPLHPY